ncbi:MAG: c-type cytochrome biogenesis protein CcmI [Rhizobiales bacterium 62-17]|nr:c-type cytochrome biogenesis protein CcmI [Hyphomicrobiales bacterium]OJY05321.1 MAG: c-type cytochrome biogenesis protein CcmI [Rhizobiales bacterium 62-17]
MIWVVFAVLTGLAAIGVLWPLSRARGAPLDGDTAFYRSELTGIDTDLQRGLVSESDAKAMRAEAARRLMRTEGAREESGATSGTTWRRRIAALASIVMIGGVSLGLYARIGNPDVPDLPLEARRQAPPETPDLMMAISRIEAHLAKNPDDGRGYEVIAPVYLRLGRYDDAAKAWANVVRLLGASPVRETSLGEALVFAANGHVTPEALAAFQRALALAPQFQQARFYIGLAAAQAGDKTRARDIWTKLVAEAPVDAEWAGVVRERIRELGLPEAEASTDARPSSEAGQAIAALPDADRDTAIRGMVANLAARLAQDGRDANGWAMLIRAYMVLKQPDDARAALAQARKALADDNEARARVEAMASELGLGG